MQGERKRAGVSVDVDAGLKGSETDAVAAGIRILDEIIKTVEASTPFSVVRQTYSAPLDTLVEFAGQDRDANLLARYHAVLSLLESEDDRAGKKDLLIAQVYQVKKMLQGRSGQSKPPAKGIIAGPQTPARERPVQSADRFCEEVLRSFPSIGDQEIRVLEAQGLLEEERLLEPRRLGTGQDDRPGRQYRLRSQRTFYAAAWNSAPGRISADEWWS